MCQSQNHEAGSCLSGSNHKGGSAEQVTVADTHAKLAVSATNELSNTTPTLKLIERLWPLSRLV